MDEKEYDKIVKNIEKEEKYVQENGVLYKIKDENKFRVIRRFELEGIMFLKLKVKVDIIWGKFREVKFYIVRRFILLTLFMLGNWGTSMYMMHDHKLSAHFGIQATYEKVKEKYWWKNMKRDIEKYVKSCDNCQRRNNPQGLHELHPIEVKEPFHMIGIDVIGPLPRTEEGNKYIVVAIDFFTKWPEAKAIKEANAKEISKFIYEEIICRHGCPKKILTDNGSEFNNQLTKNLTEKFNVQHKFSTPYHPKTNGLVERFNKTLIESLAKLVKEKLTIYRNRGYEDKNWDQRIAPILFAYRSKIQKSSKMTPFYLTYGRRVILPNDEEVKGITMIKRIEHIIEELPIKRYEAKKNIGKAQEQQKKYHDKIGKRKQNFQIGDKVLYFDVAKYKTHTGKLEEK
ncbi:retrovirus-related Pol polyprotein from transposon 412 [Rhizophagus irregularis DAOM 181602=DAOM 197198]|nr:retrovirus-related Pol polyprotein from transposon 412 [Rhizophagus irregularis DAOM 181602=DAOM 197198]